MWMRKRLPLLGLVWLWAVAPLLAQLPPPLLTYRYDPVTTGHSITVEHTVPDTDTSLWALGYANFSNSPMALRLHRNGGLLHTFTLPNALPNSAFRPVAFGGVCRLAGGGYALAGYADDNSTTTPGHSPFVLGLDSALNPTWLVMLDLGSTSANANSNYQLLPLPGGDFIYATCGYRQGDLGVDRLYVLRCSAAGAVAWQRTLGTTSLLTTVHALALDSADGSVHLAGGHHVAGFGLGGLWLRIDPATGDLLSGNLNPIGSTPQFDLEYTSIRHASGGQAEVGLFFRNASSTSQTPGFGLARLSATDGLTASQLFEVPGTSVTSEGLVRSASHPTAGHTFAAIHTDVPFGTLQGVLLAQLPQFGVQAHAVRITPLPGYNVVFHGLTHWPDGIADYSLAFSTKGFQRFQANPALEVACLPTQPLPVQSSTHLLADFDVPQWLPGNLAVANVLPPVHTAIPVGSLPICACQALAPPDTTLCAGNSLTLEGAGTGTLSWQPAPGLVDHGNGLATLTPTATGQYVLEATQNGCLSRDTVRVTVLATPPPFSLGPDAVVCDAAATFPLLLQAPAGYAQLLWQNGHTGPTLAYTPTQWPNGTEPEATDTLWLAATHPCATHTDTLVVRTHFPWAYPLGIAGPGHLCPGQPAPLVAQTNLPSWQWGNGSGADTLWATAPGTYTLQATTALGCPRTATHTLALQPPLPPSPFSPDTALCPYERLEVHLPPGPHYTPTWENADTARHRSLAPPGVYTLTLASACATATHTLHLAEATACEGALWFPSAIAPAAAGANAAFRPLHPRHIHTYSLWVFDRWGVCLFHTQDPTTAWDATHHGTPCPEGVYAYRATYTTAAQPTRTLSRTGTVTVVRLLASMACPLVGGRP
jgi:gliding motility-associated-like protein